MMFQILMGLLVFSSPAWADEALPRTSLFLSAQDAHKANVLAREKLPPGQGNIALGAVLYYAVDDWVLWLRGEKWTPQTTREDLRILKVSSERVRIAWLDDDQNEHIFTLMPNQAYQIATGKIISQPR
ncbi:MAG: hypothetical protein PHS57_07870 [Alphaproteobacteria bacterium]|nr:hypothetical protein [Alphaproteobacteria bacterium]